MPKGDLKDRKCKDCFHFRKDPGGPEGDCMRFPPMGPLTTDAVPINAYLRTKRLRPGCAEFEKDAPSST